MSLSLQHGRHRRAFPLPCWQPGLFPHLQGCPGYPRVGWDSPWSDGEAAANGGLGMGFCGGFAGSVLSPLSFFGDAESNPALFSIIPSSDGEAAAKGGLGMGFGVGLAGSAPHSPPLFWGDAESNPDLFSIIPRSDGEAATKGGLGFCVGLAGSAPHSSLIFLGMLSAIQLYSHF